METPNADTWSDLPLDLLTLVFERLSFDDVHSAKIVCWNWYSSSKLMAQKSKSPWLILFPDRGDDFCVLYNPEEDRTYRTKRDLSGVRFLANSGNWFLVVDSRSNLYIIDLFSENMINLPPLESFVSRNHTLKRVGDKEFMNLTDYVSGFHILRTQLMRGLLWVDDKTEEYIVVWFFNCMIFSGFCKKGDDHYNEIFLDFKAPQYLRGLNDAVLWCYRLYIYTTFTCIRVIDLSGQQAFEHSYVSNRCPTNSLNLYCSIAVTTVGEVLVVETILNDTTIDSDMSFRLYEMDSQKPFVKVDSIGDDALLLDLGITVPGIDSNSIYFTRPDRTRFQKRCNLDICVFNCATKTLKRFPSISNMNRGGAR